jgi:hypothetical protein
LFLKLEKIRVNSWLKSSAHFAALREIKKHLCKFVAKKTFVVLRAPSWLKSSAHFAALREIKKHSYPFVAKNTLRGSSCPFVANKLCALCGFARDQKNISCSQGLTRDAVKGAGGSQPNQDGILSGGASAAKP